jgi:hypothetical protein
MADREWLLPRVKDGPIELDDSYMRVIIDEAIEKFLDTMGENSQGQGRTTLLNAIRSGTLIIA